MHWLGAWLGDSTAPPVVMPRLLHAHTLTKFSLNMYHDQTHKKRSLDPNCQSNRKSTILTHLHAWYCNELFHTTDFTVSQFHRHTLKMKSDQKLSPPSHLLAVVVPSTLMLRHEARNPDSFNIQFPIYTKVLTHVEGVALKTSLHLI